MSAEQQNDFNLSGKSQSEIVEYLKTLAVDDKIYIFSFKHEESVTNYEVVIPRIQDDKIAVKSLGNDFPTGKKYIIIKYTSNVADNTINLSDNITIINIKEKPLPEITEVAEEDIASFMVSIQDTVTDDTKQITESLPDDSSQDEIIISDETPNFEFDIEDVIEEQVEAIDVIVKQKLSQWETQLSEEKRKSLISELLLEYYKKDKNISLLDIESQVFADLENSKLSEDIDGIISEFKPYKQLIIDGKFCDTNVYPIVEDVKLFYSNQQIPDDGRVINNIKVLPKPVASLSVDENDENITGDIEIKIQLIKDYYSGKIDGYKSYISKLFEGGSVLIDDEDNDESVEVSFNNLYATHLPQSNELIESEYYTIDNQVIETEVYRNCNSEQKCVINPIKNIDETNYIELSKRKTLGREFYFSDIYDEKDIVDNRGNRKKDVRTCNGTNKTGDTLYILGDDKLRKSITKPPEKKDIYSGETLKVVGLFIQSPYLKQKSLFANREYTKDDNTKLYPKLFNDSIDLGNVGSKQSKHNDLIIIDDITSFSYDDYDPLKNYFVYFNKSNKRQISQAEYLEYVDSILPNTTQIVDIEIDKIRNAVSIDEINKIINKYGLDFIHLSNEDVKKIGINVINNIKKLSTQKVVDNIMKYDKIELNNKFIEYNKNLVDILYDIENTSDKNSDNYVENVLLEYNSRVSSYIGSFPNNTILKIFAEKFLGIDNSEEQLDDPEILISKIIAKIIEREGIADNRSYILRLINKPNTFDSEISQFLESYKIVNGINMNKRLYLSNLDFYSNKINELSFLKQIKNTLFGGNEFINLLNLVNLENIKTSIKNRISDDISSENLKRLNLEYKNAVDIFNAEKEQYGYYINSCNSVKVKKIYSSLNDVLADNDKDINVDSQFNQMKHIVKIALDIISKNNSIDDIVLKEAIKTKFMFLSESEVNLYVQAWNELNQSNSIENINEMLKSNNINEKVENNQYALLDSDKKYLFFRKSNKWISVDKDTYTQIQKCYAYKLDLLKYSLDDIKNICSVGGPVESDETVDCIRIGDNFIPSPMYRNYLNIEMIDRKRMLVAKLLKYNGEIDSKIQKTKEILNKNIKQVHSKNIYSTKDFNYSKKVKTTKLVYPNKKQQLMLQQIYQIRDFDIKIEKLLEFIDRYGLHYSINPKDEHTDESNEMTAKWIYYDSNKIDVPICCKHYLDYKKMLFKDNKTREDTIKEIKEKWSNGVKSGEFYICHNCGEPIDNIKYSEFEGFGKDNKVINFRERVVDEDTKSSFIMPSLIFTKNSSYDLINLLVTKLGIILREQDYNFIMDQMYKVSDKMYNIQQFYSIIYKNNNLFEKDVNKSEGDITKALKKYKDTSVPEFVNLIKGLLNEFIENYPINTDQEYKESMTTFLNLKKTSGNKLEFRAASLIYKLFIRYVKQYYEAYRAGEILNNVIANLSQILIYSLPAYRLVSLGAERREKKSGFFVQNLYKSSELALPLLYNKIFQEKTATRSQPEIRRLFINIESYYRNILDQPFGRDLSDDHKSILNTLVEGIQTTNYINNLMIERDVFDLQNEDSSKNIVEYQWPTFQPPLNSRIDLTPESLGIGSESINSSIENYNVNINIILTKQAQILDESVKDVPNNEIIEQLKSEKNQTIMRNRNIMHHINNLYTKLGYLYMSVVNKLIIDIDNSPYNLSSYTSSLGFDKLDSKYTDYFKENYVSEASLIQNIETLMKKIDDFMSVNKDEEGSIDMIRLDHKPRNLQSYMSFNRELYKNDEEIHEYLMKQLKLINSITILDEGPNKYKKRHYRILMDEDYKLYVKFLLRPENSELLVADIDNAFIQYFITIKDIDLSKNDIKRQLIIKHKGYALLDIVSKKFKNDISKEVHDKYNHLSNDELFDELDRLNTDFNKGSIIEKTKTYPMINNLIPFKYNINKSMNDFINKYINSIGLEILEGYGLEDSNIVDTLKSVKFNNLAKYIENIELKRNAINLFASANITSLKSKLKNTDYLGSEYKQDLINKLINIDSIRLLNHEFYSEISEYNHKFIKISNSDTSRIANQTSFNDMLIDIQKYNSDITAFTNILEIIIVFINKIKNHHINPQSDANSKLHVKIDNKEDNLFFYGTTLYKDKLEKSMLLSDTIVKRIEEDSDTSFLDLLPETGECIVLLRQLVSLNKKFNKNGIITDVNISMPAILRVYLHDLIIFYLNSLFDNYGSEIDAVLFDIRVMLLNEIADYLYSIDRKDEDIVNTIKTKRARENINRKNAFDRMSTEMQNTQKLFRRFNIGTIFEGYEAEDVNINEMILQGEDMASDSRENIGITDEEAEHAALEQFALQDEYGDSQIGIGVHGYEEMNNLYGGDDI